MAAVALLGLGALSAISWTWSQQAGPIDQHLVFRQVVRGDLPIGLTERGTLESQQQTVIRCELENVGDDDDEGAAQVIWIVPNGKAVAQGELLMEIDAASIHDLFNNQSVVFEAAKAEAVTATAQYENQKTQGRTLEAEALLQRDLAELNLKMYGDDHGGTYKLALQELELRIQEARSLVAQAQAAVELQKRLHEGMQQLYDLGYRGLGDLEQSRFNLLEAQDSLESSRNTLNTSVSARRKLVQYERPMMIKTLAGALATAERALDQVRVDNASLLQQAEAVKNAALNALQKEQEKHDRYRLMLSKCKIHAPHAGMVVYAVDDDDNEPEVGEGFYLHERQQLFTLPDLSAMQVNTSVHESVLMDVRSGQPAAVRIDAFPDRTFRGSVKSVALLPRQFSRLSDVKIYETIVTIDEPVDQLKPGMTAVVDIEIAPVRDVILAPVEAVVAQGEESWCYVDAEGGVERRNVRLGRTNYELVHVVEGLDEGERVVLNPAALRDPALNAGLQPPNPLHQQAGH
jgi:HlyD family secretion protein